MAGWQLKLVSFKNIGSNATASICQMHPIQRIIYAFGHRTLSLPLLSKAPLTNTRNMSSYVLATESSDKGMIILNRPKALNACNLDMVRKVYKHLKKCEMTKSMVIIKGAGDKAFCAGGDVRSLVEAGPTEESKSLFREEYTLNALIGNYCIPYIAIIDGITMGGGVGLSVHGKYRVATERTLFAMPETAIGLFPDVGGSYFLPRLQGKLGLFLGLTGYRLKGDDVLKAGIATHYCDSTKLEDLQIDLLNCKDADTVEDILDKYNIPTKKDFVLNEVMERINKCFDANSVEEIVENLKNDGSDWANKTLEMHPIQRIIYAFGHRTLSLPLLSKAPLTNTRNMSSYVLATESSDKGMIILNRPKALNACNLDMVRKVYKHLKKCEMTKSMVIIKGAGDKAFCAGGDVRSLVEAGPTEESKSFFREEYTLNALIGNYCIPYIAIIDGITMGGGVGLSVHGKYRVATERTLFAMPETAIGLFPDVGGSYFLPRLQGKLGLFLGLTGYRLKGDDVLKAGIATHYCDSTKLEDLQIDLLNCKDADTVEDILDKYNIPTKKDFVLNEVMERINKCFDANSVEEIVENLKNDGSDWANKTLETLGKLSPLSLKVTFRQLELGSKLLLTQCLKMEYRMVVRHLEDSDFKEGVRALLIDKDQKPKWNPSTLEAVTQERVESFFEKLPDTEELKL